MLSVKKDEIIDDLRNQVLSNLPGLNKGNLMVLEEVYLALNVYKYLTQIPKYHIRKLLPLRNAARTLTEGIGRIQFPRLLSGYITSIVDNWLPEVSDYLRLIEQVIEGPPQKLNYNLNTYLVYLIEKHSQSTIAINTQSKKVLLGTYLNNYIDTRKAKDQDVNPYPLRTLQESTYRKNLRIHYQNYDAIERETCECFDFVQAHMAQFIEEQRRIYSGSYWRHKER